MNTDRPLLGINIGFFVNQRFPHVMAKIPEGIVNPQDIDVNLFLKDCDELYQSHLDLGDYPFVSAPFVGIPWLEAIAGCTIVSSPTSFWAKPCITDWKTWHWEESIHDNPWTNKLLELMSALVEHSNGRYPVAPTLMRGPADILSAMRGGAQLPLDIIDDPSLVMPAIEKCANIWEEIGRAQLDLIPESNEGYMAGDAALRTWAPNKILWLQEDAISLLSPQIYREFFLPVDRRLSDEFPCIAYHLHGSSIWAVDELIQLPGINVMELNFETDYFDIEDIFDSWKKIQNNKPLIIWRIYGEDFWVWLERVLKEFPPKGLSIQVSVYKAENAKKVKDGFSRLLAACR